MQCARWKLPGLIDVSSDVDFEQARKIVSGLHTAEGYMQERPVCLRRCSPRTSSAVLHRDNPFLMAQQLQGWLSSA